MTDWNWLEDQRKLQVEAYGIDPGALSGDERAAYWTEMMYALDDEVHEFGNEIAWKSWAKNRGEVVDREAALGELVDVAFFLGNLLLTLGATDEEFQDRYREKLVRNRARQEAAGGYDSKKSKCPGCSRELDKKGAYQTRTMRVGTGAGTQEDLDSGEMTYTLICNSCRLAFEHTVARGEKLP